jgi:hypothetical protein
MNLKLLKQIGSISAFLLLLAMPAKADTTFGIGIIGSMSSFDSSGTETEGNGGDVAIGSDNETTTTSVSEDADYAMPFAEIIYKAGDHVGLTWGVSYLPGSHNIGAKSRTDTAADSGEGQQATQTYNAKASVSDIFSTYIEPTIYINDTFGIYAKGGITRMTVETLESGDNSSTFGNEGIFGVTTGAGVKINTAWGIYIKLEHVETDYEDLSFSSTTGNRNSISASVDEKADRIAIGYQF